MCVCKGVSKFRVFYEAPTLHIECEAQPLGSLVIFVWSEWLGLLYCLSLPCPFEGLDGMALL